MKTNSKPYWKSVKVKFNSHKYEDYTLARVKGWSRIAFVVYRENERGWSLSADPAFFGEKNDVDVTHWLAVPVVKRQYEN